MCYKKIIQDLLEWKNDTTKVKDEVCLIEVKAITGYTKSSIQILNNYEKYKINKCIKLGEYNVGENNNVLTLPYYMSYLI